MDLNTAGSENPSDLTRSPEVSPILRMLKVLLSPHQILVFKCRTLEVDDPLSPQRDVQDPPDLDVDLCWTQDHYVVILHKEETVGCRGEQFQT